MGEKFATEDLKSYYFHTSITVSLLSFPATPSSLLPINIHRVVPSSASPLVDTSDIHSLRRIRQSGSGWVLQFVFPPEVSECSCMSGKV